MSEIERKFLIRKEDIPWFLFLRERAIIHQSYVISGDTELRIRKISTNNCTEYFLTVKSNGNLVRQEVEIKISAKQYLALRKMCGNNAPIVKERLIFELEEDQLIEICIVDEGSPCSFCYAEVEFDSEQEALLFQIKDFLKYEITYNNNFKMKNYWNMTRNRECGGYYEQIQKRINEEGL